MKIPIRTWGAKHWDSPTRTRFQTKPKLPVCGLDMQQRHALTLLPNVQFCKWLLAPHRTPSKWLTQGCWVWYSQRELISTEYTELSKMWATWKSGLSLNTCEGYKLLLIMCLQGQLNRNFQKVHHYVPMHLSYCLVQCPFLLIIN